MHHGEVNSILQRQGLPGRNDQSMEVGELVADGGVGDGLEEEIWRVKSKVIIIVVYDTCFILSLAIYYGFSVN